MNLEAAVIAAFGALNIATAAPAQTTLPVQPATPAPRLVLSRCPDPASCFAKKADEKPFKTTVPVVSNPDKVLKPRIELKRRF